MKKIVSFVLILICIVGLTACSKNKTITSSFDSPDGQRLLAFQQVGEPFSFSPADVRLILKAKNGAVLRGAENERV